MTMDVSTIAAPWKARHVGVTDAMATASCEEAPMAKRKRIEQSGDFVDGDVGIVAGIAVSVVFVDSSGNNSDDEYEDGDGGIISIVVVDTLDDGVVMIDVEIGLHLRLALVLW